jgi:hypothetical protein
MWNMLESGVYFSASCLIGLRPILSKLNEWTTNHFRSIKDTPGHPIGVGSQLSKQGVKKQKLQDPNSLTFIMNIDGDTEMESMESGLSRGDSS